jgi:hypothetical protein
MFGNPFIDDDNIVETTKSKKNNSTLFPETIELSDDKTKICEDLVKNSFCSNKKCSDSGKHPSKVIICRNMISKGKNKRKTHFKKVHVATKNVNSNIQLQNILIL